MEKDWKIDWEPTPVEVAKTPSQIISGHRMCPGCMAANIFRLASKALPNPENTIVINATGCAEVSVSRYPYQSWKIPWMHNAFENAPATASGVIEAYEAMKRKGRWEDDVPDLLVIGGDGGTYDIGFQSLSAALEREHDFTYLLYDNEAYMNTGIQRSGGTPHGASTTTTPAGEKILGKPKWKKPIDFIVSSHLNTYVATVASHYWRDFMKKMRRAMLYDGPAFVHAFSPCPRGWYHDSSIGVKLSKLAVETKLFPLFEFDPDEQEYSLTSRSKEMKENAEEAKPIEEYLKIQGRFKHLFKPKKEDILNSIQNRVNRDWEYLLRLAES